MINKSLLTLGTVISKLSEGVQLTGDTPCSCFVYLDVRKLGLIATYKPHW